MTLDDRHIEDAALLAIHAAGRRTPYPLEVKPATHRARHNRDLILSQPTGGRLINST